MHSILRRAIVGASAAVLGLASTAGWACSPTEYLIHIDWSSKDVGYVEPQIRTEWRSIDATYPGTNVSACTSRLCAMGKARQAAAQGMDEKALRLAASTQLHGSGCYSGIAANGAAVIGQYLRTH